MKPLSFYKAQTVVGVYNELRDVRDVAKKLKLPYQEVFKIIDWLWRAEHSREADLNGRMPQSVLPWLTQQRWANYLYHNNYRVLDAADSLRWTAHDVLHSCGGPTQWAKTSNRKPVLATAEDEEHETDGPDKDDPTPEEIQARALEVQARWTPSQREAASVCRAPGRVETLHWTDTRV
jgi:hypothetical protein